MVTKGEAVIMHMRDKIIIFLQQRIEEHLKKILDKNTSLEDKEPYKIRMDEDLLILEEAVGKPVKIKTEIVW